MVDHQYAGYNYRANCLHGLSVPAMLLALAESCRRQTMKAADRPNAAIDGWRKFLDGEEGFQWVEKALDR